MGAPAEGQCWPGPDGSLSTAETVGLRKLRREVRQLREDKEVLLKAATFIAKENE